MKDFKYKTSFSSAILSCSVLESSEWDSWNVSKASLSSLKELMPDVKLMFNYEGPDGKVVEEVPIPIGVSFFWPES